MKDVSKAVLDDINTFSTFREAPSALKRTFCRSFLEKANDAASAKGLDGRIRKLIRTFDSLETQFDYYAFSVTDTQDHERNPFPKVIDKMLGNFGVSEFFKIINGSDLDAAFSETTPEINKLKDRLKLHVATGVDDYPYKLESSSFNFGFTSVKTTRETRTLWEEFLDNVINERHGIAHGSVSENLSSIEDIKGNLLKLEILQFAILIAICEKSTPAIV